MVTLHLAQDPDADAFLAKDPLAVLTAMLLDQQIPMEKAFSGRTCSRRASAWTAWTPSRSPATTRRSS